MALNMATSGWGHEWNYDPADLASFMDNLQKGYQGTDNYEFDPGLSEDVGIRMFSPPKKWEPPKLIFEVSLSILNTDPLNPLRIRTMVFIDKLQTECNAKGLRLDKRMQYASNLVVYEVKKN